MIDLNQVNTGQHCGITHAPNCPGDLESIVRLLRQVINVSLEKVKGVRALPPLRAA